MIYCPLQRGLSHPGRDYEDAVVVPHKYVPRPHKRAATLYLHILLGRDRGGVAVEAAGLCIHPKPVVLVQDHVQVADSTVYHHAVSVVHRQLEQLDVSGHNVLPRTHNVGYQYVARTAAAHSDILDRVLTRRPLARDVRSRRQEPESPRPRRKPLLTGSEVHQSLAHHQRRPHRAHSIVHGRGRDALQSVEHILGHFHRLHVTHILTFSLNSILYLHSDRH